MKYSARQDYQSNETAHGYEQRSMYSGIVGNRRKEIEQKIISSLVSTIEVDSVILDCPCGNGRWMPELQKKASMIIGRDISVGMTDFARERASELSIPADIGISEAEKLDLEDGSVDYVFCYALMKHLPLPAQYAVMSEFARVARKQVICSFAVLNPISWMLWSRRRQTGSYPIIVEELKFMAEQYDLKLVSTLKVSQPIVGLEYFAVFEKLA